MSSIRFTFLLLFSISFFQYQTNAIGALSIIQTSFEVSEALEKVWDLLDQDVDFGKVPIPILKNTKDYMFQKMEKIISKLDDISVKINKGTQSMTAIFYNLPERVRLELRVNDLLDHLTRININYRRMQEYTTLRKNYERLTLEDFAQNVVSHDPNSILSLVERIHVFLVPSEISISNTGWFDLIAQSMEVVKGDLLCNARQSPQQVLYNIYSVIALTELKGYTMVQFSYMLLRIYGKGRFATEAQQSREKYKERTNNALQTVQKSMQKVSRQLWRCDPKEHIIGETYEEITKLQQGYVINIKNLNRDKQCSMGCAEYSYTDKIYGNPNDKCNGTVTDCKFLNDDMLICTANRPGDSLNSRRYEFITYGNYKVLGKKSECERYTRAKTYDYLVLWTCQYCFCMCDEQGATSDRFFNMRSVLSDIEKNRVVTGLRFIKKNRIIHLQIQEGELLPRASINDSTTRWKPVEDYRITDRKIFDGQEYHTLTWRKRAIDLDDLEADEGYVLTGVRFETIGTHLNLEIYVTKFDFDSGKLNPKDSKWIYNANTDAATNRNPPRKEVNLKFPDVPTRSPYPSIPTSQHNQYIKFTHSDIDRDAAQTTVPFLDAQKVESLQAVPLSGAGIFHKGRPFYGGFLAPKVIMYDYSKHLKSAFPTENAK